MSTVKTNNVQIGQSVTATNNFTWYQPASPDGTVRLGNGNSGSVTDLVTLTSAGNLGIGTSSPSYKLHVNGTGSVASAVQGTTDASFLTNVNGTNAMYIHSTATDTEFNELRSVPQRWVINGSERMRLDASGNLGLGVTPSAWYSGVKAIQFGGMGSVWANTGSGNNTSYGSNVYVNASAASTYITSDFATKYQQYAGQHLWSTAPSGTAGNAISFTQAMTLDASGGLALGTTSTVNSLAYFTNANANFILGYNGTSVNYYDADTQIWRNRSAVERARIDSSGNWSVGNTGIGLSNNNSIQYSVSNAQGYITHVNGTLSGQGYWIFAYNSSQIGSITQNGTTGVLYNITSDRRLKENIVDAPNALSSVNAIKVRSFDWKSDGSHVDYGYIAQELLEVVPEAVSVPANPEEMMGVDFGKLTPRLVKAIQELSAELNELKQKVNA